MPNKGENKRDKKRTKERMGTMEGERKGNGRLIINQPDFFSEELVVRMVSFNRRSVLQTGALRYAFLLFYSSILLHFNSLTRHDQIFFSEINIKIFDSIYYPCIQPANHKKRNFRRNLIKRL